MGGNKKVSLPQFEINPFNHFPDTFFKSKTNFSPFSKMDKK